MLGTNFSSKNLRMSILHALRRLVTRAVENNKEEDIRELARFAKNYLPLFLSLYTTKPNGTDEEGQRSSTYNTIKVSCESRIYYLKTLIFCTITDISYNCK